MRGFSLIELMVVIAIVAVLSAVAIPAYRDYVARAKFSAAETFVQSQVDAAKLYYTTNGVFPNITQLGLPTSGDDNVSSDGWVIHSGGYAASIGVNQNYPYIDCPYANYTAALYPDDYSQYNTSQYADLGVNLVFVQHYVIDTGSTIVQRCYYDYLIFTPSGVQNQTGDVLSGCINQYDFPNAVLDAQAIIASCN